MGGPVPAGGAPAVRVHVCGGSFMLNQIRHMVGWRFRVYSPESRVEGGGGEGCRVWQAFAGLCRGR